MNKVSDGGALWAETVGAMPIAPSRINRLTRTRPGNEQWHDFTDPPFGLWAGFRQRCEAALARVNKIVYTLVNVQTGLFAS